MSTKEELLKQYLNCAANFSKHLNTLKSIPSQNFSSLDQKRMTSLQTGIDALKILAQKLEQFSGEEVDIAAEKIAVGKAMETANELECETGDGQISEPGDSLIRKMFEAEELTGQNDFKPQAGVAEGAEDRNDFTPVINSIEDMEEAFSNYVANDYYNRTTGRNFALFIGNKKISTNPATWFRFGKKKANQLGDYAKEKYDAYAEEHPVHDSSLKTAGKGFITGAIIDFALSALKRNLSYDKYLELCELQGIEPVSKTMFTVGTLKELQKSITRGGAIGTVAGIGYKAGGSAIQGLKEGYIKDMLKKDFSLSSEDFQDASELAREQSMEIMKKSFSLNRGYYPSDNNPVFLSWIQDNAEEYFSLRTDIYNEILDEASTDFAQVDMKNTLASTGVGAGLGALGGALFTAIKRNKSYDEYKQEALRKGEEPVSKVKYIALNKEMAKNVGIGAGAGAGLGAVAGVSGLSKKLPILGRIGGGVSKKLPEPTPEPTPEPKRKVININHNKKLNDMQNLLNNSITNMTNKLKENSDADKQIKEINKQLANPNLKNPEHINSLKNKLKKYEDIKRKTTLKPSDFYTINREFEGAFKSISMEMGDSPLIKDQINDIKKEYKNTIDQIRKTTLEQLKNGQLDLITSNNAEAIHSLNKLKNDLLSKYADKHSEYGRNIKINNYTRTTKDDNGNTIKEKIQSGHKDAIIDKLMKGERLTTKEEQFVNPDVYKKIKLFRRPRNDKAGPIKTEDEIRAFLANPDNQLITQFFSLYGYYPTHSTDMTWQNFCYQQVFSGNLSVSDLDGLINFNELQHHEEFANVKATIGTGVASAVAGGVGGMFLANKKIKAEEKRLGRPLTADEKAKIRNKYVATGAVGAGVLGAGAAHGLQVGADKGNATASNIVNKITAGRDKVTGAYDKAYNKGFEIYNKGKNKVDRLVKRHLHGLDYQVQDKLAEHSANQQADIMAAYKKSEENGYDSLTYEEKQNLEKYYGQVTGSGLARKAKIVAGAGLAYKFLWPVVKDAMASGAKVDTDAINAYVAKLKAEGKTEEEIQEAVRRYMNQAFYFSRIYR